MDCQELVIKVCGMREEANIRDVEALGIDWLGLIFWPKSSRYVNKVPDYLPRHAKRVGVFVDETPETIMNLCHRYAFDYIQLHGQETTVYIDLLRHLLANHDDSILPPQLIKAFSISTTEDLKQTKVYEGQVDYYLFDTKGPSVGGNGIQFDWEVLSDYHGQTPFLLSGGIGPEDAERIRAFHHPRCIGIDLNSKFELSPGLKDIHQLESFLEQLKK